MGTWGLSMQIRQLQSEKNKLGYTDEEARDFNSKIENLINEISEDIVSENVDIVIERVEEMKDRAAASSSDDYINDAKTGIDKEIATIQAVIRARKAAAKAMESAGK